MIRGIHGLFYTSEAEATRAFIRDKLMLPYTDVGDGWLIFDLPAGDIGVHPINESSQPPSGTHNVSFYCDDIRSTVAELKARGVPFTGGITDSGYGFVTYFTMPGGVEVEPYEPKYQKRGVRLRAQPKLVKEARPKTHRTKTAAKRLRR